MEKMYNLPSWLCWALLVALIVAQFSQDTTIQTYIGLCILPLGWYIFTNLRLKKLELEKDGTIKK
jgi:hypothetical protein